MDQMMSVKSDGNLLRRRNSFISGEENNDSGDATKCVVKRRRRRSPTSSSCLNEMNNHGFSQQQQPPVNDIIEHHSTTAAAAPTTTTTTVKRSSRFRGVSRHRWTGRYEAHLWDKGTWNATQKKKGKQVYLGAYDIEEAAARAYDLAAIKYWGTSTFTNFPVSDYEKEVEIMENSTKEEYLASLRRRSSGFSRGVSKYRGVARHHHNGRWEARIGRVFGNKYLYLGTYSTQEEAAHAYDIAAIEYRGINAVTNFDLSTYIRWLRSSSSHTATAQDRMMSSNSHTSETNSPHLVDDPQFSFNSNNLFPMGIPHNQQLFEPKVSATTPNESSPAPTALSLLLKSSMFKQLVEKNLNAADEQEFEENDNAKNESKTEGNEFRGIFFNGMCPKMESLSAMELDEELEEKNELPLFSNIATSARNQPLWNGSLNMNMSSSRH